MKINKDLNGFYEIIVENDGIFSLDFNDLKLPIILTINENINASINIDSFYSENSLSIFLKKNSLLKLKLLISDIDKSININEYLEEGSTLEIDVADFSLSNNNFRNYCALDGENASAILNLSSLAKNKKDKKYNLSFDHLNQKTISNLKCFGVSLDESIIEFKGTSSINKDCIKSEASQDCKVILFDENSKSKASPTIKIDCDDVKASHGCAIGSINDLHIFYLLSRGLSLKEARKLITLGYLEPIKGYFDDKQKEIINNRIGEAFND